MKEKRISWWNRTFDSARITMLFATIGPALCGVGIMALFAWTVPTMDWRDTLNEYGGILFYMQTIFYVIIGLAYFGLHTPVGQVEHENRQLRDENRQLKRDKASFERVFDDIDGLKDALDRVKGRDGS